MATVVGRTSRIPSRTATTRATLARRRRNLLLPILLLVAVSLIAVCALVYWSAESVNRQAAVTQDDLVRSVMQIRKESLRQLVIEYAWQHAPVPPGAGVEDRWNQASLPSYLRDTFGVSAGWVVGPDNAVHFSFENGRVIPHETAPMLPRGTPELVTSARKARSVMAAPMPVFTLWQQDLALVAASAIVPLAGRGAAVPEGDSVLVFLQPMDLSVMTRAGIGKHVENLYFRRGAVPPGYLGCEITGLDGRVIGSLVWRDQRLGDAMLWKVAPVLAIALVAVCVLLFLVIKRVETVVSREGLLSLSLYQEKQRRSQKSDFVSMVSHELRTPLQAIGTAADMLERFGDQMSEEERREESRTIRRAVGTLARLVDDILVMGRAEAAAEGSGEPVDLARLCRAVWREVSVALRAQQQMVLRDHIGGLARDVNDAALHTILSNLMQNAIKYSRGVGDVEIELRRQGADFIIAVSDQGPGVPPEEREAIFQPYWRSRQVDGIAGTGLGLSVARAAARSLGGDLSVEDREGGHGARFVVRWPARQSWPGAG